MLYIFRKISTCYKNVTKNDATVNLPHWNFSMTEISLISIFKSWHLCLWCHSISNRSLGLLVFSQQFSWILIRLLQSEAVLISILIENCYLFNELINTSVLFTAKVLGMQNNYYYNCNCHWNALNYANDSLAYKERFNC